MSIFIHLGLPRTGTTFFQQNIFPKIKNYNYFHNPDDILVLDQFDNVIFSSESMSYNRRRNEILQKLKKLYPQASIIIGLRDIEEIKRSLYCHSLGSGYYCDTFENFIIGRHFLFDLSLIHI